MKILLHPFRLFSPGLLSFSPSGEKLVTEEELDQQHSKSELWRSLWGLLPVLPNPAPFLIPSPLTCLPSTPSPLSPIPSCLLTSQHCISNIHPYFKHPALCQHQPNLQHLTPPPTSALLPYPACFNNHSISSSPPLHL